MPVPLLAEGFGRGLNNIPYAWTVIKAIPWLGMIYLLKIYFSGAKCQAERVMHGKVVMGGTSGVGAEVVRELATRGGQIILLTHHSPTDAFLVEYIDDLRTACNNELIYAEQVDMSSLHSIRLFATKWVDNAPPRRLDAIILCANTMTPRWGQRKTTVDGVEEEWMVNYLANFHLLSILSPAIRAQPPDRDVRILFGSCSSYIAGKLELKDTERKTKSGSESYARSKLALMTFCHAFQKHLDAYVRTRRWLTGGSLIGLVLYLVMYPIWWLVLKSPDRGAQSFLTALFEADYGHGAGAKLIKECRELEPLRPEVKSEDFAKKLWEYSEKQIERLEKQGAVQRAMAKKEAEGATANGDASKQAGRVGEKAGGAASSSEKQTAGSRRSRKAKGT
ncbi:putative oxido [Cyphellophora attinorum]|uniref:Putative oxido n=1 Tax=Cyphellophora attinorum TaxID=1664694 RepID=A0A0N0NI63_9EURO|nr:putative oxido [Phialophora attinorum]KPI35481.1 putative oxido [Phialophora attinorum]